MNKMFNKKTIVVSFIVFIFIAGFASITIAAEGDFVPLETIPGVIDAETAKDPSKFFNGLFTFGIAIAGFLAVIMIAYGGIQYMSTDAVSGKGEGREKITYAIMGLLLVLFAYILLNTINPDILKFDLFNKTGTNINNSKILQQSSGSIDVNISAGIPATTDNQIKLLEDLIKNGNISESDKELARKKIFELKNR